MKTAQANPVQRAGAERERAWNFGAGPAMLPAEVLEDIRAELPDYRGSGQSVLEIGHRTELFHAIAKKTEADLRELMQIPDDYAVLFLHGGATLQYAMVPLNLAAGRRANYLVTGHWSAKAAQEAQRLCNVQIVADAKANGYTRIPAPSDWQLDAQGAYLHYTVNETIGGIEFHTVPEAGSLPLVADMTSMALSRPVDVARHALIYASAQKNLGVAGITVVVVRRELLDKPKPGTPSMLEYRVHAQAGSLQNTPPVFAWYVTGKMLEWIRGQGGVAALAERNRRKAEMLYAEVDRSGFYVNRVNPADRSRMNVPFGLRDATLEPRFLTEATAAGLLNLTGHRSAGGVRASIYNAMPEQGVHALTDFMREFERRHG